MLSSKELRVWAIGILVLVWVMLAWGIADHFLWAPEGTPVEQVHQLAQRVQLLTRGVMALAVVGLALMTRVVVSVLRVPHPDGDR